MEDLSLKESLRKNVKKEGLSFLFFLQEDQILMVVLREPREPTLRNSMRLMTFL